MDINRKLKILKAILLLRKINTLETKEEQLSKADELYTDIELDEWIIQLKDMISEREFAEKLAEEYEKGNEEDYEEDYEEYEDEYDKYYMRSASAGDYSPSHPWDAPGMSIRDFLPECK